MSYRVRVAARAAEQIRVADAWWVRHRSKSPSTFADEIERAFEIVRGLPGVGELVAHSQHEGLRRLLLGRVRYYLYYVVSTEDKTVDILALWHTARGAGPNV